MHGPFYVEGVDLAFNPFRAGCILLIQGGILAIMSKVLGKISAILSNSECGDHKHASTPSPSRVHLWFSFPPLEPIRDIPLSTAFLVGITSVRRVSQLVTLSCKEHPFVCYTEIRLSWGINPLFFQRCFLAFPLNRTLFSQLIVHSTSSQGDFYPLSGYVMRCPSLLLYYSFF